MSMNISRFKIGAYSGWDEPENDNERRDLVEYKRDHACSMWRSDVRVFCEFIDGVLEHKAWEWIGLESFDEFAKSPWLDRSPKQIEMLLATVKKMKAAGATIYTPVEVENFEPAAADGEIGRGENRSGVTRPNSLGNKVNTSEGHIRKLKRDQSNGRLTEEQRKLAADLLNQVAAGKVTPNAAAERMGYRKKRARFVVDDIDKAAASIARHYGIQEMIDALEQLKQESN